MQREAGSGKQADGGIPQPGINRDGNFLLRKSAREDDGYARAGDLQLRVWRADICEGETRGGWMNGGQTVHIAAVVSRSGG